MAEVKLEDSWRKNLESEFEEPYFKELTDFIHEEYKRAIVYPNPKHIFRAFDETSFDKVRVVILGQDPYHGAGQANGLCFSVNAEVRPPPSLRNIFKEL